MNVLQKLTRTVNAENEIMLKVNSRLAQDTNYIEVLSILVQEHLSSCRAGDAIVYSIRPRSERLRLVIAMIDGRPIVDPFDAMDASRSLPPRVVSLPAWKDFRWSSQLVHHLLAGHDETISRGLDRWHRRRKHTLCIWSLLVSGTQPIGLLGVAMCQKQGQESLTKVSRRLSQQIALALQMAAVAEADKRLTANAAVNNERRRIATDLHDILAYSFTAVLMQLEAAKELLLTRPDVTLDCISRASLVAKEALQQSRQAVMKLQETHAEPLINSLPRLVAECENGVRPTCSFSVTGLPRLLPTETERHLLRISQEALGNARRYANANKIDVSLAFESTALMLVIEDDGVGFNISEAEGMGFGLSSMSKRAERIGASFSVRSSKGAGTTVSIRVESLPSIFVGDKDPANKTGQVPRTRRRRAEPHF